MWPCINIQTDRADQPQTHLDLVFVWKRELHIVLDGDELLMKCTRFTYWNINKAHSHYVMHHWRSSGEKYDRWSASQLMMSSYLMKFIVHLVMTPDLLVPAGSSGRQRPLEDPRLRKVTGSDPADQRTHFVGNDRILLMCIVVLLLHCCTNRNSHLRFQAFSIAIRIWLQCFLPHPPFAGFNILFK